MGTDVRTIAFMLFDKVNLLDVAGPLEAFWLATSARDGPAFGKYRPILVSLGGGPITTSSGVVISTEPCDAVGPIDTLIVPGGGTGSSPAVPTGLPEWIVAHAQNVRRLCSVCTGAFVLAATGKLDGCRVTTHWAATDLLQRKAPRAIVDGDSIYIHDRGIWTCAGVTAGIDLSLALIEDDHGYGAAMNAARYLVVYLRRPGTQSQQSKPFTMQIQSDGSFDRLHTWIRENLSEDLTIERLADFCAMSTRTFSRHYKDQTGRTPAKTIIMMRIEAAQAALERGSLSLKQIARDYGFGDERNLRRALSRTPQDNAAG